jgi:hypothetical protein
MNIQREKINDTVVSIVFESKNQELLDIDDIFVQTNRNFAKLLTSLGIIIDFDFKKRDNVRLYTNEFIQTFVEFIKNRTRTEKLSIYSNLLTKDAFRNRLVRKLKTMFGFNVLETHEDLTILFERLENKECAAVFMVESFLNLERKCKSFKYIKKYFEKHGFKFLNDVYFKDFTNKLCLFI